MRPRSIPAGYADRGNAGKLSRHCDQARHFINAVTYFGATPDGIARTLLLLGEEDVPCRDKAPCGLVAKISVVGEYTADRLVEHIGLVESNVAKAIDDIHRAQCLNDLKATGLHLCLLLNFGKPGLAIKRIVLAP